MNKPYYLAYEERYQKIHALQTLWGHSPQDEELRSILARWIQTQGLSEKRIAEFACGEGAAATADDVREIVSTGATSEIWDFTDAFATRNKTLLVRQIRRKGESKRSR